MITPVNKPALGRLAQLAISRNLTLVPEDDSLLMVPVEETRPVAECLMRDQTALESFEMVTAENNVSGENSENAMQDYAELIGEGIRDQMSNARNVIRPFINDVMAETLARVSEATIPAYSIVQVYPADIHDNPAIYELMSEFESVELREVAIPVGLPLVDEETISGMCRIGSTIMDKQLSAMIANYPEGWLESIYQRFFATTAQDKILFPPELNKLDELLIVYLIANYHALNENPELEQMYPHRDNETVFLTLKQQAAAAIIRGHRNWDTLKSSGQLVLAYPISSWFPTSEDRAVIRVIGDNYESFLHAGGTPEMVIGSCVGSRIYRSAELLEQKDYLHARYAEYISACNSDVENRKGSIVRDCSTDAVGKLLMAEGVDVDPGLYTPHNEPSELIGFYKNSISLFSDAEIAESAYRCVRIAVCNALFAGTSALEILTRIDVYLERYTDLEPRQAAYQVAADMIVDHLMQQVRKA